MLTALTDLPQLRHVCNPLIRLPDFRDSLLCSCGGPDGELRRRSPPFFPTPASSARVVDQMVSYVAGKRFLTACIEYSPNVPT